MSATLSEVLADAILAEALQPALCGRRLLFDGLYGVDPAAVFGLLETRLDTTVSITTEAGRGEVAMRGVTAGRQVLIPYLVDDSSASENAGTAGFAATLRTQFADGPEDRVLLICASAAVETVSSATEQVAHLPSLSWKRVTEAELDRVSAARNHQPTQTERDVVAQFAARSARSEVAFARLSEWLKANVAANEQSLGQNLWKLGCFLADPKVHDDPPGRLTKSNALRRKLDELFASSGKSFAVEVRKLVARGGAPTEAADRIIGAAGAFELDYGAFVYEDAVRRTEDSAPLTTDRVDPFHGAIVALRQGTSLVAWCATAPVTCTVRLARAIRDGETVRLRWTDGTSEALIIRTGEQAATFEMPAGAERSWRFGTLTTGRRSSDGTAIEGGEALNVAVHRSDAAWFAVENAADVDATREAFNVEREPIANIIEASGNVAATYFLDLDDDDGATPTMLVVTHEGASCPLPILSLGEGIELDPDDDDDEEDTDDAPEEDAAAADDLSVVFASVPHALLTALSTNWPPDAHLSTAPDSEERTVNFRVGARRLTLATQRPGGLDGAQIEQAILASPEWTSYTWSPDARQLRRGAAASLIDTQLDQVKVAAFLAARETFFATAKRRGSVYATDPTSEPAAAYVQTYLELLQSAEPAEPASDGWNGLLLCDAVDIGGRASELYFAPTSPLAVAFHAGLLTTFTSWAQTGDIPAAGYRKAISLRHALPLVHAGGQAYEATGCNEVLWRRYTRLGEAAEHAAGRNVRFIAQRLRFFLKVHPSYQDPRYVARQALSVTFANPPDAATVLGALADFYAREKRDHDTYTLPRLDVTIVSQPQMSEREIDSSMEDIGRDDLVRLVQSRVVVRAATEPPAFSHIAFVFRTPGTRQARKLSMTERPSTAFLNGLAAAPARHVREHGRVFTWGTWAPRRAGAGTYAEMMTLGLELAGAQPTNRVDRDWTNLISTEVDRDALQRLYNERAIWVVHLDRLLGIEAFAGNGSHLIEYEDRADPDSPGYDGITSTQYIEPYRDAIARALRSVDVPQGSLSDPKDAGLEHLLQRLNAVSGRWAIEILQRGDNDILRTVGFVAAIAAAEQLEQCIGSSASGTGVLIALDEILPGVNKAGVSRIRVPEPAPDPPRCDDLLLLWAPHGQTGTVTVRGAVIEVKFQGTGGARLDEARGEIGRTRQWLLDVFNTTGASCPFRARDLAELIASAAARASTFRLGSPIDTKNFNAALQQISDGNYELDLRHWRGGYERTGIAVSMEAQSTVATAQGQLPLPGDPIDHLRLGKPALADLIADRPIRTSRGWEPMTFEPPAATDPRGVGSSPTPTPDAPDAQQDDPADDEPATGGFHGTGANAAPMAEVEAIARDLDAALARYNLGAEPFQPNLAQVGPNVIRFRTRPLGTVGVADISRRAADLGREIGSAHAIIVSQEPYYICIDVPRRERQAVPYPQIAGEALVSGRPGALDFIVGVAPSGDIRTADLARLPHLLVAGATGSGKSVFLRSLLCHLVRTRGPERLRLLIIDPKQLDFRGFRTLPHLEGGRVVTEPLEAIDALRTTIERERERRLDLLESAGVSSAVEYYEQGGSFTELPQMVVLIDEFADLVGALPRNERDEFLAVVQRYVQITRAMGIYLVLATQRPSVDVITGTIKANLPARVALSLPSNRDSQTIIDQAGAEDLLGGGDLLFYLGGRVERLQGTFASTTDIATAAERWRGVENPRPHRYWEDM